MTQEEGDKTGKFLAPISLRILAAQIHCDLGLVLTMFSSLWWEAGKWPRTQWGLMQNAATGGSLRQRLHVSRSELKLICGENLLCHVVCAQCVETSMSAHTGSSELCLHNKAFSVMIFI